MKKRNLVIELTKSQQEEIEVATKLSLKSVVLGLDEEKKEIVFKGFVVNHSRVSDDFYLENVKLRQPCMVHEDDGDD